MTLAAVPDLTAVPAPFWLVTVLHLLTFTLHLVAMGTLVGGLVTLLARRGPGRLDSPGARRLISLSPVLMAATVTLGVAPLLFLQLAYGRVAYSAAVASASFWLQVPFAAMLAYGLLYAASHRPSGAASTRRLLALALAALAWVSLIYASTFSLAERPGALADAYAGNAGGWLLHADLARWLPRWAQAMSLAVAIGAFGAGVVAREDTGLRETARRVCFTAAVALPVATVARFVLEPGFGGRLGTVGWVATAAGTALPFAAAWFARERPVAAGGALAAALVAAVVARHVARLSALEGVFDPAAAHVHPQTDVFMLFVLFLLVAVGVIAWMLRTWFRAGRVPAPEEAIAFVEPE